MSSCGELVAVLPRLSKLGRALTGGTEQAAMLLHLGAIEQLGTPRMSDLAAQLQITQSTMSRRLSELRGAGLVHLTPDPDDGRCQHVSLTDAGRSELQRCRCSTTERLTERLAQWSDQDVAELVHLLSRLSSTVQSENPSSRRESSTAQEESTQR